jgi:hypothetical protein
MQGDIMLPEPQKPKAASKPKPSDHKAEPLPDIVLDESAFEAPKKRRRGVPSPHKHFKRFWRFWQSLGLWGKVVLAAAILLILGAAAVGWFYFLKPNPAPAVVVHTAHEKPKPPLTAASPLTGLQVDPALAKRPVTGVMIENSVFARPQSGLQEAGVVYEAIAEGGITRFLALFQEAKPQYIGPVRSLRPYYLDFAAPFQASIAHVGGSPAALREVRSGPYRDIDQFFNSSYYWRSSTRAAPHNVYTNFDKLDKLNKAKKYKTSLFTVWPRKTEKKLDIPTAKAINFKISGPDFYVHYDYDPKTNTYPRKEGGAAHINLKSASDRKGVRLSPKVVIALIMPYRIASDGQHSVYDDSGTGRAYFFQDGGVEIGSWEKGGIKDQIIFKTAEGKPMLLNAGQTWLTLLANKTMVGYGP